MVIVTNEWQVKDGDTIKSTTPNINITNNTTRIPNTTAIPPDTNTNSEFSTSSSAGASDTRSEIVSTIGELKQNSNKNSISNNTSGNVDDKVELDVIGSTTTGEHSRTSSEVISEQLATGSVPTVITDSKSNNNCNSVIAVVCPVVTPLVIMDVKNKSDEANGVTTREKHESETNSEVLRPDDLSCESNTDFELENNNLDFANLLAEVNGENSNTNTLLGSHRQSLQTTQSREMTLTPSVKTTTPASINTVLNSVLSANSNAQTGTTLATTTTTGAANTTAIGNSGVPFQTLGITLNNGALTQQQLPPQQQQLLPISNNNKGYGVGIIDSQSIVPGNHNNTSASTCGTMVVATSAIEVEHSGGSDIDNSGEAKIILLCETNSHPFQTRTISLTPNIECKVGRLIAKSKANEGNAIFDCKVLSRNHAVLWYTDDGKFWVKDTKSSNGTFINDNKLGNDPAELHYGDIVKFGVDVLENSRKEVHGCIIALVKLYLPDGRESISIDAQAHRQQFSGGNRITFDEMQRLNSFMQEASQREKVLKQKLCNLQNVLDATRKNSALCWQSMISEDQLLHKINLLEKKVQVMEKNVPENTLRNEIMKLMDDKTAYQLTAKEALRKVYQERCDALQMLSKMEAAYATSENECGILRDQIMNAKQALQEVNERLLQLETEYNEYKDEAARVQREAKEQDENSLTELRQQLADSIQECEALRSKVAEIEKQLAEQTHEDKLQEQQALAKLDEVIGNIDLGIDDDEGNDENEIENNAITSEDVRNIHNLSQEKAKPKSKEEKALGQKVVRKSTVMNWLQNSDLNKGEDAQNLLKAFLNAGDENEHDQEQQSSPESQPPSLPNESRENDIEHVCTKFSNILQSVQMNLQKIENESKAATRKAEHMVAVRNDGSSVSESDDDESVESEFELANDEFMLKGSDDEKRSIRQAQDNKKYQLLQESVNLLRDGFNGFCQQQTGQNLKIAISDQAQFQNNGTPKLQTQETLVVADDDHAVNANNLDELPTEQTLEMLQVEIESWKDRYSELNVMVNQLREQKEALDQIISNQENPLTQQNERISAGTAEISEKNECPTAMLEKEAEQNSSDTDAAGKLFEEQMRSELASINSNQLEQEEELILYKERLEQSESCNLQLRNEINQLKFKHRHSAQLLVRQALPFGAVAIAALVYLLSERF